MAAIVADIFARLTAPLVTARDRLATVALSARQGIDLGLYFGPVARLGPGWQAALATLTAGAGLVAVLLLVRGLYSVYLDAKQGLKWW